MPFTPNLVLERPLNGSYVGTWDTPVNNNWDALDNALGAVATVALSNVPVVLAPAQYACGLINFTGTLTADVEVTFPALGRIFWLQNNCVSNTTFKVTTWVSSLNQYVALPPNEAIQVMSDGTDMKFVGLGRVGTYWDFGGSAVPIWVTGSNPAPYLNCDGTAFSSATYPALRDYLGAATLPDARGRYRASLNQGTARLTGSSATGGINANTILNTGGNQTFAQGNLPNVAWPVTDPGHFHTNSPIAQSPSGEGGATLNVYVPGGSFTTDTKLTGIGVRSGGSGNSYAPPSYVGGLTLIRAG